MNLVEVLQEIRAKRKLDGNTVLRINRKDGTQIKGNYVSCISAADNDPEIAQIDLCDVQTKELVGILETEIQSITAE